MTHPNDKRSFDSNARRLLASRSRFSVKPSPFPIRLGVTTVRDGFLVTIIEVCKYHRSQIWCLLSRRARNSCGNSRSGNTPFGCVYLPHYFQGVLPLRKGVEARRLMRVFVEPEADRVFWFHVRVLLVLDQGEGRGRCVGISD